MKRIAALAVSILALVGCAGIDTQAPTPVDFVFPTPVTPTVPPTIEVPPTPTLPPAAPVLLEESALLNAVDAPTVAHTFTARAGQVVRVDATLIDGDLSGELTLVDMFNNTVASLFLAPEQTEYSIAAFAVPYRGTYRLRLEAFGGAGTVQTRVTPLDEVSGAGGNLPGPGSSTTAFMGSGVIYHTYRFPLEAGDVVSVLAEAVEPGTPDLRVALYGPAGSFIAEADDIAPPENLNARLGGIIAEAAGTYTAIVSNVRGSAGDYAFSVLDDTQPPTPQGEPQLTYLETLRARLADGDPLAVTFDGTQGDVLRLSVFDVTEELAINLYVVSPFGQIMAFATATEPGLATTISEVQLPYTGRYALELHPTGSGEASFTISPLGSGSLTGGGRFTEGPSDARMGQLNGAGVFHGYQFDAIRGETITLSLRPLTGAEGFDPGLALLAPNGQQIAYANDEDAASALLDALAVEQTGTYTVIVYGEGAGRYEISLARD